MRIDARCTVLLMSENTFRVVITAEAEVIKAEDIQKENEE